MAHARGIKPGLYKNEDLAECSVWARLLFPGLWMLADREGRLEDRPKRIKGELFPFDSIEVGTLLDELSQWGFIERYAVNGKNYIQVVKFSEHQRPHATEKDSTIPDKDGFVTVHDRSKNGCISGTCRKVKAFHSELTVNQTLANVLIPDSCFLIPDTGSKQQQGATTVGPQEAADASWAGQAIEPDDPCALNTETPPPRENTPEPEPHADAVTVRAVEIAVLLRKRGAGVAAGDPRLRSWAERGHSDAVLLTALETAERRRTETASLQPVNAGLLDAILADVPSQIGTSPPARASPSAARDQQRTSWTQRANPRIAAKQGEIHHEQHAEQPGTVVVLDAVARRLD